MRPRDCPATARAALAALGMVGSFSSSMGMRAMAKPPSADRYDALLCPTKQCLPHRWKLVLGAGSLVSHAALISTNTECARSGELAHLTTDRLISTLIACRFRFHDVHTRVFVCGACVRNCHARAVPRKTPVLPEFKEQETHVRG